MIPSSSHDRRIGCRAVSIPMTGPIRIVQKTKIVISAPAVVLERPCAETRYGTPHSSTNTIIENWVPM